MSELLQDAVNALVSIADSLQTLARAHGADDVGTSNADDDYHVGYGAGYRKALDDHGLHPYSVSVTVPESVDDVDKAGG
jgi:hypothetical protein